MDFITIDVETANADMASICQIGIAKYSENKIIDEWVSLVNPEDYFDSINVDIHGINELDIFDAPTFPEIVEKLLSFFQEMVVVSHTHFDKVSVSRAFSKYHLEMTNTVWLDSAKVARRAWPEFSRKGYGLKNVAKHIGYEFKHHDALEDAKAAGAIMLEAIKISNMDISDWQKRVTKPINPSVQSKPSYNAPIKRDGNPEGELFGEVIVFTGALEISRKNAADLAANIGCVVTTSITKKTTLLVVGDQDILKLGGKSKSSKHIKAEEFIKQGQNIRIIQESDFKELLTHAS